MGHEDIEEWLCEVCMKLIAPPKTGYTTKQARHDGTIYCYGRIHPHCWLEYQKKMRFKLERP